MVDHIFEIPRLLDIGVNVLTVILRNNLRNNNAWNKDNIEFNSPVYWDTNCSCYNEIGKFLKNTSTCPLS